MGANFPGCLLFVAACLTCVLVAALWLAFLFCMLVAAFLTCMLVCVCLCLGVSACACEFVRALILGARACPRIGKPIYMII